MVNIITRNAEKGLISYIIQFLASNKLTSPDISIDKVSQFQDALDKTEMAQTAVNELKKIPEVNIMFKERWLPAPFNLDELSQLPEGTLGQLYADHIKSKGFKISFYQTVPVVDDISYLNMLWRTTHDFYHIVGGFGTDEIGEVGVQSFLLAQTPIPISSIMVSFALVRICLYEPDKTQYLMSEISRGYNLGSQTSAKFIAQKWDKYWDVQISDIRANLGMKTI
ncbi:Coq4 family protein [Anabaena sp. CCY 0017]|uniref:Coq4 family protein n=1 Tax=Anabaena sp. CCY 0017 TaxID=3103866 RepID=UPI0039C6FCFB